MLEREQESAGLEVCALRGMTYADLKTESLNAGLTFKVAADLENELLQDRPLNRSRRGPVAYYSYLFLLDSGNRALADQGALVLGETQKLKGSLHIKSGDIGRVSEYLEIILENWKKGVKLLEKGKYPYLSARTRTRVFDGAGPQNYVVDIGPLDPDGLRVHILGRDEEDPEVGVWPLFYLDKPRL